MPIKKCLYIAMVVLIGMTGCQTRAPHRITALGEMKEQLKEGIAKNQQISKEVLPDAVNQALLSNASPESAIDTGIEKLPEEKYNIAAKNVPAQAFFLGLVEGTDQNVILNPGVSGDITLNLKNVSISEVFAVVRKVYGYGVEYTDVGVRILPVSLQTRTFKVNYLNLNRQGSSEMRVSSTGLSSSGRNSNSANSNSTDSTETSESSEDQQQSLNSQLQTKVDTNFWTELKESVFSIVGNGEGRNVSVSPMAGLVIVQAMPEELSRVEQFLKYAERSLNRQVILEAKILEVELQDSYRSGINWGQISKNLQISQLGGNVANDVDFPSNPITNIPNAAVTASSPENPNAVDVKPGFDLPVIPSLAGSFKGVFTLGMNYKKLSAFVELLGMQGNVQVLSSPRVSTTNNQKALIKVGVDEFFVTNVSSSTTTNTGGPSTLPTTDVTFDSFFSGIALDVTPQISDDDYVTLHIHPTVTSVSESTKQVEITTGKQTYPLAKSSVRESDSIIRAKSGQLVVIGGLMQDKNSEVVTGVPLLKDIPFFGQAFRHQKQEAKKSELVILLRPIVMDNNNWTQAVESSSKRIGSLDRGFHQGGSEKIFGNLAEGWGEE